MTAGIIIGSIVVLVLITIFCIFNDIEAAEAVQASWEAYEKETAKAPNSCSTGV